MSDSGKLTRIDLGTTGVHAALDEAGTVRLFSNDQTELVSFPESAAAFEEKSLLFLLQVYSVGYGRGRTIGKELVKARIRDLLGPEL